MLALQKHEAGVRTLRSAAATSPKKAPTRSGKSQPGRTIQAADGLRRPTSAPRPAAARNEKTARHMLVLGLVQISPTSPADREISVFQDFFWLFSDVSRWLMVGGLAFQASNAV